MSKPIKRQSVATMAGAQHLTDLCHGYTVVNYFLQFQRKQRSIPRAQTSPTPSLRSMKQSSQAFNVLANCSLCNVWHILKISWKSIHPFFSNLAETTDPRKNSISKGLHATSQKCFRLFLVSYLTLEISWKSINLFFFCKIANRVCLVCRAWNSLVRCKTVQLFFSCLMLDISWKFHQNPFIVSSIMMLKTRIQKIGKKFLYPMGYYNIPKMLQIVSCVISTLSWKFNLSIFPKCY